LREDAATQNYLSQPIAFQFPATFHPLEGPFFLQDLAHNQLGGEWPMHGPAAAAWTKWMHLYLYPQLPPEHYILITCPEHDH